MMVRRIAIFLLLLGGCLGQDEPREAETLTEGSAAEASPATTACRPEWNELDPGLRHRTHCENETATLHLVEVDPRRWTLEAARVPPATAPAVARDTGARFAINANFFDPERKTLGAIVTEGETVQRPHPVSWQSIFYVNAEGEAGIALPDAWTAVENEAAMAVQAGPRIVVDGAKTDANRGEPSLRSGVCVRADGHVLFFVTAGTQYYDVREIADLAALGEDDGGLGCRDAMLFDGGPSAQMHLDGTGISIEGDRVPAFVLARPRRR